MKKIIRIVSLLLVLMLFVTGVPDITPVAQVQAASLSELYDELNKLNKEQSNYNSLINSANKDMDKALAEVKRLNGEIQLYEDKIAVYNNIIQGLDAEIGVLQTDLEKNQAELDVYYEIYYERVRANYEAGQTSYLEVLLGAGNFTDFLTRIDVVEQIMVYDNNLIKLMNETIETINTQKTALEEKRAENETARAELDAQQTALEKSRSQYQTVVNNNKKKIQQYQAAQELAEKKKAELNKEIDKLVSADSSFAGGTWVWPTPGVTLITSRFGYRKDPMGSGTTKYHSAIDIGAPYGTTLRATNSGKVIAVSYETYGGYYIAIDHGGGYSSRYYHLSAQSVKVGQQVTRGDIIGRTGNSGRYTTGPHLHFEIHAPNSSGKSVAVDPLLYVTPY